MKALVLITGTLLLVFLFFVGLWLFQPKEPTIPLYPNATITRTTPYFRQQSYGPSIKTLTLTSSDAPHQVRQWYKTYFDRHWHRTYRSYTVKADMYYANEQADLPDYIIGVTIKPQAAGSLITIQLAKR